MKLPRLGLGNDLLYLLGVLKPYSDYSFAFIIHPRSYEDIWKKFPLLRYLPRFLYDLILTHLPPVTISSVTGLTDQSSGDSTPGWIIALPMPPQIMLKRRELALKRIRQAVRLAENRGVNIVGLGGLTSSLSQGGILLKESANINLTTGHALTAHIVSHNVLSIAKRFSEDLGNLTVGIVGAAGSIGSTTAKVLARAGIKKVLLVDLERKIESLKDLADDLSTEYATQVVVTSDLMELKKANYVVTATNAPGALVKKEHLKDGAIIVDDAQPSDVADEVFEDENHLVVSGGVVETPGIKTHFDMGLRKRTESYSCMGELLCLAAEKYDQDYVIARATLNDVDNIESMMDSLGFALGKYQNKNGYISDSQLNYIQNLREETESQSGA